MKSVAVVGAGIYGCCIAIRLASRGIRVTLFDPLGILCASSGINQFRVHAGYHYPRSKTTIQEVLRDRIGFMEMFSGAIVKGTRHYYAIPKKGSLTTVQRYEEVMNQHGLSLVRRNPPWMDFSYIERCYEVEESIYDPTLLRAILQNSIKDKKVAFNKCLFTENKEKNYDFTIYATYGTSNSHRFLFDKVSKQVAEKILIRVPEHLRRLALVVIDGPFSAFDCYGDSELAQFGSAKHTNHWKTNDPQEDPPERYGSLLHGPAFEPVPFTNFELIRDDAMLAVPDLRNAEYMGSRFAIRMVEDNPIEDRRILHIQDVDERIYHVFSGKVVSAIRAANYFEKKIVDNA